MINALGGLAVADAMAKLEPSGHAHGKPADDMECLCTMEDITVEAGNYCEFQSAPSMAWSVARFSSDVIRSLILRQFDDYVTGVRKADCAADLKRRIGKCTLPLTSVQRCSDGALQRPRPVCSARSPLFRPLTGARLPPP